MLCNVGLYSSLSFDLSVLVFVSKRYVHPPIIFLCEFLWLSFLFISLVYMSIYPNNKAGKGSGVSCFSSKLLFLFYVIKIRTKSETMRMLVINTHFFQRGLPSSINYYLFCISLGFIQLYRVLCLIYHCH